MFELSVAAKYLMPRWRQLSVSIISIISILVIALVVWLIVVFFSVTNGLTNNWIDKLIALTAPVRITPTENYYKSYYYLVDGISSQSDYNLKTIGEKLNASPTDPYDPNVDEEPPASWRPADRHPDGILKDPVKEAYAAIAGLSNVPGITARDFEMTVSNLRLRLLRHGPQKGEAQGKHEQHQGFLSQAAYLGSMDSDNPYLSKALISLSLADLNNLLTNLAIATDNIQEDAPEKVLLADQKLVQERFKTFFDFVRVNQVVTPGTGWPIPTSLFPDNAQFNVVVVLRGKRIARIIIPQKPEETALLQKIYSVEGYQVQTGHLIINGQELTLKNADGTETKVTNRTPIVVSSGLVLPVQLNEKSIIGAKDASEIRFHTKFKLQNIELAGEIPLGDLKIHHADVRKEFTAIPGKQPFWSYQVKNDKGDAEIYLPSIPGLGDGILLPKSFRESGAMIGDAGYLSYYTPTASSVQEQRIPVFVAGFYDPGIIPIGGKYVLANKDITTLIRASHNQEDTNLSNGINVRFADRDKADQVKSALQQAFREAGIDQYWKIETFREFDFTKDILQQLRSEKRLFTLLATLIIIVACSNIISMLIILVNDKKLEIGILRSMGATSSSVAAIFGICGIVMGVLGSVIGIIAAVITLKNIQMIVDFISRMQGYDMFNPVFYGNSLPTDISVEALSFVIIATALISLIAGIVPAVKASLLRPSAILRSE